MVKNDEHTKLARVGLRFSPKLDEAFKVNVAKMRVQLPTSIRDAIEDAISPVRGLARKVYDRKEPVGFVPRVPRAVVAGSSGDGSIGSLPSGSASTSPVTSASESAERLTIDEWTDRLRAIASPSEASTLESLVKRLHDRRADAREGGGA